METAPLHCTNRRNDDIKSYVLNGNDCILHMYRICNLYMGYPSSTQQLILVSIGSMANHQTVTRHQLRQSKSNT